MKKFIIILPLALVSCSPQTQYKLDKKAPIVEYNQPYDVQKRAIQLNEGIQKHKEQTVFMFNKKEISHKKFRQLVKKGKINSMMDTVDKDKIVNLGYSYDQVKRIVFTSSSK